MKQNLTKSLNLNKTLEMLKTTTVIKQRNIQTSLNFKKFKKLSVQNFDYRFQTGSNDV